MRYSPPTWLVFITIVCSPTILYLLSLKFPFLTEYYIIQGLFIIGAGYIVYRIISKIINFIQAIKKNKREEKRRKDNYLYTSKELDRAFSMLHDLDEGIKPHSFSYPQYKELYYSPYKYYILNQYHHYFNSLNNKRFVNNEFSGIDDGLFKRSHELANFVFQKYPMQLPKQKTDHI